MALLMLKKLPRYESLARVAHDYPELDNQACDLFLNLLRTGDAVTEIEDRYLATHGLTPGRFAVMMLLGIEESGALKPSVLADMTGVTRATITGLLDTLERDGMIRRKDVPNDRRATSVEMTSACRALLKKVLPGYLRLVSAIAGTLTETEQKQFATLSRKIHDGLMLAEAKFVTGKTNGSPLTNCSPVP